MFDEDQVLNETLWSRIVTLVPFQERDALKRIIGSEQIDDNEDLFSELSLLKEILSSYSKETEKSTSLICHRPDSRREAQCEVLRRLYSRLQYSKIKFVAKCREQQILDYVEEPVPQRPSTARSSCSSPSSARPSSSSSSLSSLSSIDFSSLSMDTLKPHLNIFNIDHVVKDVQHALTDEKSVLESDIEFVRSCIESEESFRKKATTFQPPSLSEMMHLEQKFVDLLNDGPSSTSPSTPPSTNTAFQNDGLDLFRDPDAYYATKKAASSSTRPPLQLQPKNKFFTPTKKNSSSLLKLKTTSSRKKSIPTKKVTKPTTSKQTVTAAPRLRRRLPASSKAKTSKTSSDNTSLSQFLSGSTSSTVTTTNRPRRRPSSAARLRSQILSARQ